MTTDTLSFLPRLSADSLAVEKEYLALPSIVDTPQALFEASLPCAEMQSQRVSLFQQHLLPVVHGEMPQLENRGDLWFLGILILAFALYAWVISFHVKRVGQIIPAIFSGRGYNRLTREGDLFAEPLFMPLVILVLLSFSLLIYRGLTFFELSLFSSVRQDVLFLQIFAAVGGIYLFKIIWTKLLAWIFKEQASSKLYLLNNFLNNACLALFILPLLVSATYGEPWLHQVSLYACLGLCAVSFVWRSFRSFWITKSVAKFSYVHIFLYLCTLEIGLYLFIFGLVKFFNAL